MREITGNFWDECTETLYDAIVCTINLTLNSKGHLIMGKGIAKEFKEMYGDLPEIWGERIKKGHKFPLVTLVDEETFAVGLPTKIHWKDKSPEDLIVNSCKHLVRISNYLDFKEVLMTRPGCGCGGLIWENLKPKLSFLDNRFVIISN